MWLAEVGDPAELFKNQLVCDISNMNLEEVFTLAIAFGYYPNLMGIAETHQRRV